MGDYDRRTPVLTNNSAVRLIVVDTALLPHVSDALGQMTTDWGWEEVGDPVDDVTNALEDMIEMYYQNDLIGMINTFALVTPDGWLDLDGETYAKADYPELALVIPAGWISGANFTLPDMQDVFVSGAGSAGTPGATSGANSYELDVGQLPSHSHLYTPPALTIEAETPTTPLPTAGIGTPTQTGTTGDGDTIDNRPDNISYVVAIFAGRV
jgi:microcystin-dependent protein